MPRVTPQTLSTVQSLLPWSQQHQLPDLAHAVDFILRETNPSYSNNSLTTLESDTTAQTWNHCRSKTFLLQMLAS